jgi:hypothetical protein
MKHKYFLTVYISKPTYSMQSVYQAERHFQLKSTRYVGNSYERLTYLQENDRKNHFSNITMTLTRDNTTHMHILEHPNK